MISRKVLIIAEAGVNHNGDMDTAKQLVDAAVVSGADFVKFQTFKARKLVNKYAPKANYQIKTTDVAESQFQMIKKLELDLESHIELINYCKLKKISFLSSPFDVDSVSMLIKLGLEVFKIPSGEITNLPYLKKIGSLGKEIILSTGVSEMKEIADAINILTEAGTSKRNITILHCNTEYPTPFKDINLRAMLAIRDTFNVKVGYSDHSLGIEIPIAATALGATVIEKHFTLDKHMDGPDHKASIEPSELKEMVDAIRHIEVALGDGKKRPSSSELKNKDIIRKSIHIKKSQSKGYVLKESDLEMKRPGHGISPMHMEEVIGKKLKKDLGSDTLLKWEDLK